MTAKDLPEAFRAAQFKPGQSGNPSGRPRKKPITERYEALLEVQLPDDLRRKLKLEKGSTYGDALALRQIQSAITGRNDAAKEIADRVEGKAIQGVHLSGPGGGPVRMQGGRGKSERPLQEWTPEQLAAVRSAAEEALREKPHEQPRPPAQGK